MKKIAGFIGLAFLHLMVACASMGAEIRPPTAVTDFKSVAGKWEGLLIRDHSMPQNYDRVTLVIGGTGAYENIIMRTRTMASGTSVSSIVIRMSGENGNLALTDGKLSAKGEKGGQATLRLYGDPGSSERMLRVDAKDSEGVTYAAELKRSGDSASAKR